MVDSIQSSRDLKGFLLNASLLEGGNLVLFCGCSAKLLVAQSAGYTSLSQGRKCTHIFGTETSAEHQNCGHQCDRGACRSDGMLLPPLVQGKAGTLVSTGDAGLSSLGLVRRGLGTKGNRNSLHKLCPFRPHCPQL